VRILLVRLRLIGDVVFTTPVIRALRRHYPEAHLSYVVEQAAAPVLRDNPHLDELIVVPKRSGAARLRDDLALARRLRRGGFDVAIDLHGGPRSAWLTWASGAPKRIGYTIKGRSWMYTHVVARAPDLTPRHSVRNQWDLLESLGIAGCDPSRDALEMVEDAAADARVDERLRAAGFSRHHRLVVIHVSAGNPFRRWPADSFAALAAALVRGDPNRRIMLTAGPSDRAAAAAITEDARARLGAAGTAIVHGEFDIAELRAIATRAAVYIGGDSGPLHIAATTRTPIVELLGPTLAERSRPWRDPRWFVEVIDAGPLPCRPCHQRRCVPGDFRCLTGISPERVLAAAEQALAKTRGVICLEPSDAERRPDTECDMSGRLQKENPHPVS
jgi:lipopolysaccharide heptosyltransferase II